MDFLSLAVATYKAHPEVSSVLILFGIAANYIGIHKINKKLDGYVSEKECKLHRLNIDNQIKYLQDQCKK